MPKENKELKICEHDFKMDRMYRYFKDGELPPEISGKDTEHGKIGIAVCTKCGNIEKVLLPRYKNEITYTL